MSAEDEPNAPEGTQLWYVQNLLRQRGSKWGQADDWQCPAHEDTNASLGVGQGEKGVVIHCSAGCKPEAVLTALGVNWNLVFGWEPGEPGEYVTPSGRGGGAEGKGKSSVEKLAEEHGGVVKRTAYPYRDPEGNLCRTVYRFDFADGSKTIRQKVHTDKPVIYRQSMVTKALALGLPIYVVEGEKSADRLNAYAKPEGQPRKAVATTAPGGAGSQQSWTPEHGALLAGADRVVIVADRDEAGLMFARAVYESLIHLTAHEPVIVQSKTEGKGDDIVEHLDAGYKVKDLVPVNLDPDDGDRPEEHEPEEEDGDPDEERPPAPVLWPSPNQPLEVARKLARSITHGGIGTIRHWRDTWLFWMPEYGHYIQMEEKQFRGQLSEILREVKTTTASVTPEIVPWNPKPSTVKAVMDMLDGLDGVYIPPDIQPGYRFSGEDHGDRLYLRGQVVDLRTYAELEPSPDYFTLSALPWHFDPEATAERWERFLAETFAGDQESVALLQEWFGYVLTSDTSAQKFLALYGPPGSGKTTIDRVLRSMLGDDAVAAVTVESLGRPFGMAQIARASLAVVGDASWGLKDMDAVVETLKGITGENTMLIEEKYQKAYSAKPSARLMLVSNERPSLRDASGAIMRRLMVLETAATVPPERRSAGLFRSLEGEMAGIINWSLEGLARLRKRQRVEGLQGGSAFTVPSSTLAELEEVRTAQSDIQAFAAERLHFVGGDAGGAPVSDVCEAYREWRMENGLRGDISTNRISRELHAAFKTATIRRGTGKAQRRCFLGVELVERNFTVGR